MALEGYYRDSIDILQGLEIREKNTPKAMVSGFQFANQITLNIKKLKNKVCLCKDLNIKF